MTDHEPSQVTGLVRQSYAGAIRQRLAKIERKVHSGMGHEAIRRELAQEGVSASIGTFRKSLSRARVWWRKQIWLQQESQRQAALVLSPTAAMPDGPAQSLLSSTRGQGGGSSNAAAHRQNAVRSDRTVPEQKIAKQVELQIGGKTLDLDRFFERKSVFRKS